MSFLCFLSLYFCSVSMERDPCGSSPGRLQRGVSMETRPRQRTVPQPKIYSVRTGRCFEVLQQARCERFLPHLSFSYLYLICGSKYKHFVKNSHSVEMSCFFCEKLEIPFNLIISSSIISLLKMSYLSAGQRA